MTALDLVGAGDIAERLNVTSAAVSNWRSRGLLPTPLAVVSSGAIWPWSVVHAWAVETGRIPADVYLSTVTDAHRAEARETLLGARAAVARSVDDAARAVADLAEYRLARPPRRVAARDDRGRLRSLDGGYGNAHGEWDWYYALPAGERARLSRSWMTDRAEALAPDQLADVLAAHVGTSDLEEVMAAWTRATALADAARSLARGHLPRGIDVASLVRDLPHDPASLWGPSAVEALAARIAERAELDAELASRPVPPCVVGPSPLEMDYEPWAAELAAVDAALDALRDQEWPTVEETRLRARREELAPSACGDVVDDPAASLADVYVAVVGAYLGALAAAA